VLKQLWSRLKTKAGSEFGRALSILVGGTAAAQALTMAAMPLLSRIYEPADFGVLAVFIGIVTTVAVGACLRFDIAIALPESEEEALQLLLVSMVSTLLVAGVACLILWFPPLWIQQWLGVHSLGAGRWLIPMGIFAAAVFSALQNWQIRQKGFTVIALGRLMQAIAAIGAQSIVGIVNGTPLGLIFGAVLGFAASAIFLSRCVLGRIVKLVISRPWQNVWNGVMRYRRFPLYSTWEALANQAAIHVPIVLIASALEPAEAGYLMLAMYVIQAPMSLLGSAISQVYLSSAAQEYREGRLPQFTQKIVRSLLRAGCFPIGVIGLASPVLFPFVFGESWERAGWLVLWMCPWFLLQFLVSPVSMALHVVGAQRTALILQIFMLVMRCGVTWAAVQWLPYRTPEAFAISGALVYGLYLLVVLRRVGKPAVSEV
jgi:O-antigen/teichoic acid export membrane protein